MVLLLREGRKRWGGEGRGRMGKRGEGKKGKCYASLEKFLATPLASKHTITKMQKISTETFSDY